jgi:3-keto-disaccharide hydrolase
MRLWIAILAAASAAHAAGWKQLFNGKDMEGWTHVGPGKFVVESGLLKTEGGMGLLWYNREKLGNCEIRVVYKTTGERDNSGLYIRMPEPPPDAWYGVHNGYEVQIDGAGDEWHSTGALYSLSKVTEKRQKPPGQWNILDIVLKGQQTVVKVNGKVVNTFEGGQAVPPRKQWYEPVRGPRPDSGYIGLQNHDGRSSVFFKEIAVKR